MRGDIEVLEPELPIVDPHLHLWDIPEVEGSLQEAQRFLVPEAACLIAQSGHAVSHTVFVECHAMYRPDGPAELRSLGETEFASGMAAMAQSGRYGSCLLAHRIVANVDLCLGDGVLPVLEKHMACAGERFVGIRTNTAFSEAGLFGAALEPQTRSRLSDPNFLRGARVLSDMGLSLDVWCLHPQLPQVIALAKALPNLVIVVNHAGTIDLRGEYAGREHEAFVQWQAYIQALAELPNIYMKISGLSMDLTGPLRASTGDALWQDLAQQWRARFDVLLSAFGPHRCMFASNYPADRSAGSYNAIWNAFKHLASQCSAEEKYRLLSKTAAEAYRMAL